MEHTLPEILTEDGANLLTVNAMAATKKVHYLKIPTLSWDVKTFFFQLAMIIIGYACVEIYNWLFKASIPPILGVITGAINGGLVTWCIARTGKQSQENQ